MYVKINASLFFQVTPSYSTSLRPILEAADGAPYLLAVAEAEQLSGTRSQGAGRDTVLVILRRAPDEGTRTH